MYLFMTVMFAALAMAMARAWELTFDQFLAVGVPSLVAGMFAILHARELDRKRGRP